MLEINELPNVIGTKTKVTSCKHCGAIITWLDDPSGALNAAGSPRRLPYVVNSETGESTGTVHQCKIRLEAWKAQLQVRQEKERQLGRSQTRPCPRCGKLIYWSYIRLSKNGKPLPIDDGTDEFHSCPHFQQGK